jgi:lipopolysaccharide biosynthesis protein
LEQHGVADQGADPFADYLRQGRPEGPWSCPVIVAGKIAQNDLPESKRVALHIHAYYPELLPEIITRLSGNLICPDLFVSVTDLQARDQVNDLLKDYRGTVVDVRLVPNRGRDIGPLLTAFGQQLLANYDYVGHIHTKKTADLKDSNVGQVWYLFLLENLLGGVSGAMADCILARLKEDVSIGMVYPDDPNIVGWSTNRELAESLTARIGLEKLPEQFDFPVGTMFWSKTVALSPLVNLNLDWDDYPDEPLPYDGTMLHAIERLLPLTLPVLNLRRATTNVFGLTR